MKEGAGGPIQETVVSVEQMKDESLDAPPCIVCGGRKEPLPAGGFDDSRCIMCVLDNRDPQKAYGTGQCEWCGDAFLQRDVESGVSRCHRCVRAGERRYVDILRPTEEEERMVIFASEPHVDEESLPPWSAAVMDRFLPPEVDGVDAASFFYAVMGKRSLAELGARIRGAARKKTGFEGGELRHLPVRWTIWVRHHWVLGEFTHDGLFNVYDSAPSRVVEHDLCEMAPVMGLPIPRFRSVPRQHKGSQQCGVFVFGFHTMLEAGIPISSVPCLVDLQPVVDQYGDRCRMASVAARLLTVRVTGGETDDTDFAFIGLKENDDVLVTWRHGDEEHSDLAKVIATHAPRRLFPVGTLAVKFAQGSRIRRETGQHSWSFPGSRKDYSMTKWEKGEIQALTVLQQQLNQPIASTPLNADSSPNTRPTNTRSRQNNTVVRTTRTTAPNVNENDQQHRNYATDFMVPFEALPQAFDTQIPADELLGWRLKSFEDARGTTPYLVWADATDDIRRGQLSKLHHVLMYVKANAQAVGGKSLDAVLSMYLDWMQKNRGKPGSGITWTTVGRNAGALIAALAMAPYFADNVKTGLFVGRWHGLKHALSAVHRKSQMRGVTEPVSATLQVVRQAAQDLDLSDAAYLLLCWFSAQRPGDVLNVRAHDVTPLTTDAGNGFKVLFREGKVVFRTGKFHISFLVTDGFSKDLLTRYFDSVGTGYLFPTSTKRIREARNKRVRDALRKVNPSLELKSLRRGSLQCMAARGASAEELMIYSRHKEVKTLRQYLGYDAVPDRHVQDAIRRSAVLGGEPSENPDVSERTGQTRLFDDWCELGLDGSINVKKLPKPDVDGITAEARKSYPLHLKEVAATPVRMDVLRKFAEDSNSALIKEHWKYAVRFLEDESLYSGIPNEGPRICELSDEQVSKLTAYDNIAAVSKEEAKNYVRFFLVPEDLKKRFRIIRHPYMINMYLPLTESVTKLNATRRNARFDALEKGADGALELDFCSWFERFPLSEEVSKHFCFTTGGRTWRCKRMPTGATFSADVGTAATSVLLDGVLEGLEKVNAARNIDNVRFTGPRDQVVIAAWRFVQRCKKAGADLNDIKWDITKEQLAARYSKINDFQGDVLHYDLKLINCRDTQVEKLKAWDQILRKGGATYRQFMATYCTVLHMSDALGIPGTDHMAVRNFFRGCSRELARNERLWDRVMKRVCPMNAFRSWIDLCVENRPAKLERVAAPSSFFFLDASKEKCGVIRVEDGSCVSATKEWTDDEFAAAGFDNFGSSVTAEPIGAKEVIYNKMVNSERPKVLVMDHQGYSHAFRSGRSYCRPYHDALRTHLRDETISDVLYLKGSLMPADGISRGKVLTEADQSLAKRLAAALGDLYKDWKAYRITGGGFGARIYRLVSPSTQSLGLLH